ncbi:MAG: transcriptional regulator NrdR [Tepidisphaeraceae bacterium]|jgi:transcriptional repressor NrdR
MRCPFCEAEKDSLKVIDSRTCESGKAIRRRRQCLKCSKRFTTYEKIEQNIRLNVVKKDGRRIPWDQKRIISGLERACFKRPVPDIELQRLVDEVEEEVFKTYDREVPSEAIGRLVTERLRRVDQVAYVRFASVYKEFKTLEELVDEAKAVIDSRRYEDPSQGRLFVDAPPPPPADGENGSASPAQSGPAKGRPGRGRKTVQHSPAVPSQA